MKCIEVSHMYSHEQWGQEQELSLSIGLSNKQEKDRIVFLLDNYNSVFKNDVEIKRKEIDFFVGEKDLIVYFDEMLGYINKEKIISKTINNKLVYFYKTEKEEIAIYEKNNDNIRIYCVFLCLIWYSCRFLIINNQWFKEKPEELINVLNKKYESIEVKVLTIIKDNKIPIAIKTIYY